MAQQVWDDGNFINALKKTDWYKRWQIRVRNKMMKLASKKNTSLSRFVKKQDLKE